jgi:hypothetical protein
VSAILESATRTSHANQCAKSHVLSRLTGAPACWIYVAAIIVGVTAVTLSLNSDAEGVAQLERIAPRIERAQTLSPEARTAVERVVSRQSSLLGSEGAAQDSRRKLAIDRVTAALKTKDAGAAETAAAKRPTPHVTVGEGCRAPDCLRVLTSGGDGRR